MLAAEPLRFGSQPREFSQIPVEHQVKVSHERREYARSRRSYLAGIIVSLTFTGLPSFADSVSPLP
jgi:hypothetical protein